MKELAFYSGLAAIILMVLFGLIFAAAVWKFWRSQRDEKEFVRRFVEEQKLEDDDEAR